jgi:hypothetical protein
MNYLIGISGKAGHGKDSLAGSLEKMFHSDKIFVQTVYFAEKLKRITADILDVDYHYVDDGVGKITEIKHMGGITGREADQVVGTDIARKIYPDVWIYHYNKRIRGFLSIKHDDMVILTPDVRFENEYKYIKNIGRNINIESALIRVVRPGYTINFGAEHESETALDHIDDWDYKIVAEDLIELKRQAKIIFDNIMK